MSDTMIRVRFAETDLLGHVNNASYFVYLEQARVEFFEKLEESRGPGDWKFILASVKCDFLKQVYFRQTLHIATRVTRIGHKSFQLEQPIFDAESGETVARGESVIIYYDFAAQKSAPIPPELRTKLQSFLISEGT